MRRTTNQLQNKILKRKPAELVQVVRNREGITTEKSADVLDEVQYAFGLASGTDIEVLQGPISEVKQPTPSARISPI
jgi:hypothetical protein